MSTTAGRSTRLRYNAPNLPTDITDALGHVWKNAYDALGNRIASVLPSGKNVQWLYYGSGHLHQIRVDGHTISDMERDALHQEISRTQGALTSRYGLDPMGRLVAHKVSREAALKTLPGAATQASLRDRDPPSAMSGPPGLSDLLARLPHLPSGHRIARHYQYDRGGNLTATQDSLRGASEYRYDALGRILSAHKGTRSTAQGTQQGEEREQFTFDPAGNLLNPNRGGEQSAGGVSHEREKVPTNRLTVYQDLRFTYDLHGNVVQRLVGWHTVQNFRYSAEHQIVEATVTRYRDRPMPKAVQAGPTTGQADPAATVQTTRYRYDALGRRIDKTDAFGKTRFVYDGDLLAGEMRGSQVSEYLYEPDSFVPLAKLESEAKQAPAQIALGQVATKDIAIESESEKAAQAKDFAVYYYQCDQIGAPQELTDEAGRIVWAASYKVWGQAQALQMLRTGTDGEAAVFTANERPLALATQGQTQALNLVEQPLRFQGQYFDGETGLHYNRFRYYDPVTGRFVHQDPIGLFGGTNFFAYAPNASGWFDPFGLAKRSGPGIREKLYPSRVRKGTRKELEEKQKGSDGNIACAICSCQLGPGNTSVQHSPPLVETHNALGFNTDQAGRNDLCNSTADSLACLPFQKAVRMSHAQQYRTDTGPKFKPRKSRRKDGC